MSATQLPPRRMGFWMCLALVIGNVVGSGVYLLPASLAPYGLNSIFGWLITSGGAVALAVVFARLAKLFPKAGGPYVYARVAFGDQVGFLTAWGYWIGAWVGNAAIAIATVAYLAELIPWIKHTTGAPALASCVIIWVLTYVNWRGAREVGGVQIVTTVLKLLPLIAIVALGLWLLIKADASVIQAERTPFSWPAINASAILTLWAFLGLESATVPARAVDNPERNVPLATLWGTLGTAAIYILTCSIVVLLLPGSQLADSSAPLADVIRMFWGDRLASTLALFAFISGFGALNGWILLQAEMPRVLANEGVFPKVFARESRHGTPGASLAITGLLLTTLVLMNYSRSMVQVFTFIILIATSTYLVMYLCCAVAALKLCWNGLLGEAGRKLSPFLLIAMLASAYSLWTLFGAGAEEFWWSMALFAAGVPVYWLMQRPARAARPRPRPID
ncbi:amino acid permease [Steroidobacter agaridevorans]|uniref:amino acid permease n=1 Tax=Steroidobacter agaridevorans TaxID=2695856 RepID=UPI001329A203|nr:amino acid permease [Steroidobacter agaridevorans]GFE89250.1 amino acid permease [Steroidobacter agaridevorans]